MAEKTKDEDLLQLYDRFDYILHIDDGFMIIDIGRWILWGIISLLVMFNNFVEGAVHKIVGVKGFYESPVMQDIMDVITPLVMGLFVISIFVLGFQFMLNKIEKREEVVLNVLLAVSVVLVIPILITQMHGLLGYGVGYTSQLSPSLSGTIVQSNVADLKYYMDKKFVVDDGEKNKYIGSEDTPPLPQSKFSTSKGTTDFTYGNKLKKSKPDIEITETIDIQEDDGSFPWTTATWVKNLKNENRVAYDFMLKKRQPTGDGDKYGVVELHKNAIPATKIGREAYYRWHVNWGTIIFTLGVTSFALGITVIKVGRMMFDIAFTQFFGMFVAVTDLTGGQRTKKVLLELLNSFGVLFIMVFIMQLFIFYANWVNSLRAEIGFLPVILLLIAGAWAMIDAPDIVQRMMGIDAGLRSGYGALMGAYASVGLASKGAQGTKNLATGAMSKGAGIAGLMSGAGKGIKGNKTPTPKMPNSKIGKDGKDTGLDKGLGQDTTKDERSRLKENNAKNDEQRKKQDIPNSSQSLSAKDKDGNAIQKEGIDQIPSNLKDADGNHLGSSNIDVDHVSKKDVGAIPSSNNENKKGKAKNIAKNKLQKANAIKDAGKGEIPHGYSQKPSGFIVPNDASNITDNIPDNSLGGQDSPIGGGGQVEQGGSTVDAMAGQIQQISQQMDGMQHAVQGYGGQGGVFTGSGMFHRMRSSFNRGQTTGMAMTSGVGRVTSSTGNTVKNVAKGGYNATVGTVRAVAHPKQAMSYAGVKMYNLQTSTAQATEDIVETVKSVGGSGVNKVSSGFSNTVKQVKTPLGHTQTKNVGEKTIRTKRNIKKNNDIRG